jgi:4-hydroxythreonine-4-phosphate dehydrogenase
MKVYVTQGHEEGIGLEVFFKSCLFLPQVKLNNILLIAFKASVRETLISLNIPFEIQNNSVTMINIEVPCLWQEDDSQSQSFSCLELGMKLAETGGILFTLPTSKDQFPGFSGHTEYFRHFYHNKSLGMFFSSPEMQMLLITDHISIKELELELTEEKIYASLQNCIKTFHSWGMKFNRFYVAGLNPHAGEGGLIGTEDNRVEKAVKRIRDKFKIDITGPFPGDSMLREKKSPEDVLVYLYHDQGLGIFKALFGFIGSNITFGLPFPRYSPDHGTSFNLFAKNKADYRGCQFSLGQALGHLERMSYGQNTSYKSKSSQP